MSDLDDILMQQMAEEETKKSNVVKPKKDPSEQIKPKTPIKPKTDIESTNLFKELKQQFESLQSKMLNIELSLNQHINTKVEQPVIVQSNNDSYLVAKEAFNKLYISASNQYKRNRSTGLLGLLDTIKVFFSK